MAGKPPVPHRGWRAWAGQDSNTPSALRTAALVQAAEAAVVLAATVLSGIDTAAGRSYQMASGIALTVIGAASAVVLALVAVGVARASRWSRTPALLTQLFVGIVGIYLLQGHRLDWGLAAVLLAAAGFVTLLLPASMRALTGQDAAPGSQRDTDAVAKTGGSKTGGSKRAGAKAGGAAKASGGTTRQR